MSIGRPAVKKLLVINELRKNIALGTLKPGAKIPTRREISSRYKATLNTVQQALSSLEQQGFIYSLIGNGTFVTDTPPCLNDFALVFQRDPQEGLYWQHLVEAAKYVVNELGYNLSIYTEVDKDNHNGDFDRLLRDVRNDRVAGIIFSNHPFNLFGTDIMDKPGIPRIMMGSSTREFHNMSVLGLDSKSFIKKSIEFIQKKNIKSAAVIGQASVMEQSTLFNHFEKSNIRCPYYWRHSVELNNKNWAKNITRLLFDKDKNTKPEVLIILDDNLFRPAIEGVLEAQIKIPEDLEVIVYSNFPWQMESSLPVTKIGYNMVELLEQAMTDLEGQRSLNETKVIKIPAVFEDEISYEKYSDLIKALMPVENVF